MFYNIKRCRPTSTKSQVVIENNQSPAKPTVFWCADSFCNVVVPEALHRSKKKLEKRKYKITSPTAAASGKSYTIHRDFAKFMAQVGNLNAAEIWPPIAQSLQATLRLFPL